MTEDEIDDLNKGDILFKLLAVSQILWLCIQLVTRVSRKLPTTQLEIVTLAFAVVSIITYVLLYNRPKDVQTTREMHAARFPTPTELTRIAVLGPDTIGMRRRDFSIPNNVIHLTDSFPFGNYEFPTPVERKLWQASAIVTIATMPTVELLNVAIKKSTTLDDPIAHIPVSGFSIILFSIFAIFAAARLFILVEIIRSLSFQPAETFRTTWGANVPHVG